MIKKNKNAVPCTFVINDLNGEEIVEKEFEKKLRKRISKNKSKRVIKK